MKPILAILVTWKFIFTKGNIYESLGNFLQVYQDNNFKSITILCNRTINDSRLEFLLEGLEFAFRPFNVLKIDEISNEELLKYILEPETVIISYLEGYTDILTKVQGSVLLTNSWIQTRTVNPSDEREVWTEDQIRNEMEVLKDLTINTFLYYYQVDLNGTGNIYEIYRIRPQHPLLLMNLLYNITDNELILINGDYIFSRRRNLHGHHFRIGYVRNGPFFQYDEEKGPSGIFYEIYQTIKGNLNITDTFVESIDGSYGTNEDSGIIGMLSKGDLDISILDFDITEERSLFVDFFVGITMDYKRFFLAKKPLSHSWLTYFGVFSWGFWGAIVLSTIGFIFIIWVTFNLHSESKYSIADSISIPLLLLGALSIPPAPLASYSRILVFTICLVGAMIYWCYNAGLTSVLTVEVESSPISTINDLLMHPEYKLIIEKGTIIESMFKTATTKINTEFHEAYNMFLKHHPGRIIRDYNEIIRLLKSYDNYVIFSSDSSFQYDTSFRALACVIVSNSPFNYKANIGWVASKNFSYLPIINFQLEQIKQTGILEKYLNSISINGFTDCNDEKHFRPIQFSKMISVFTIAVIGIGVSILVFVFEFVYKKWQETTII